MAAKATGLRLTLLWSWTAKYSQIFFFLLSLLPRSHRPSTNLYPSMRQLEKYCIERMDQLPVVSAYLEANINKPRHRSRRAKPPYFSQAPMDHVSFHTYMEPAQSPESAIGITMMS